jgi:regulator of sigma E protease
MEILVKIAQFVLSLSILIVLHELGHFMFAKLFGTRVEKFYLFFDPWFSLFKIKRGDTEYGIGWVPLGGYVKISGMIDESMDKEQLKQEPQPWEFRTKPSWQRLLIMVGGVLMNFIFAMLVFSMVLYAWGDEYLPTENAKYGIVCDSIAKSAGFKTGDKILSVDNKTVDNFMRIVPEMITAKSVQVKRNDSIVSVPITNDFIKAIVKGKNLAIFTPRVPFIIEGFPKNSAGQKAGLKKNDQIVGLNQISTPYFNDFKAELAKHKNKKIDVIVVRDKDTLKINATVSPEGLLGVIPQYEQIFEFRKVNYGFFESFPAGISKGINSVSSYLKQLKLLFKPETKAYESVGGFISIGNIFPGIWDWQAFWNLTAFLSIVLAVMNILPIPALDGGHVLFLLFEIITGRKPSDKFLEYAQIAGMVILFSLLIYANGNDILKLFTH